VMSSGVGKDIESAIQNAAEAALTQVVGSFIDSNKIIEKRKEIKNGIKSIVPIIEYSIVFFSLNLLAIIANRRQT